MSPRSYVAVCPPTAKRQAFSVWLSGPNLTEGTLLADCDTVHEADHACVQLAIAYRCRAIPLGPSAVTAWKDR